MDEFTQFRTTLMESISRDLVGPYEEEEVIEDSPASRYISGILFSQMKDEADSTREKREGLVEYDEEDLGIIEQTSSFFPSAMGLSFMVPESLEKVSCTLSFAKYQKLTTDDYHLVSFPLSKVPESAIGSEYFNKFVQLRDGNAYLKAPMSRSDRDSLLEEINRINPNKNLTNVIYRLYEKLHSGWRRIPTTLKIKIDLNGSNQRIDVTDENLELNLVTKIIPQVSGRLCTLTAINTSTTNQAKSDIGNAYFQVSIKLLDDKKNFLDLSSTTKSSQEDEELSLGLLYSNKKYFATGHGTSVGWDAGQGDRTASSIYTQPIPMYELPQMDLDSLPNDSKEDLPNLEMHFLSHANSKEIAESLNNLVSLYSKWIDKIESEGKGYDAKYSRTIANHISNCRESASRMVSGIELLMSDDKVFRCFLLANEAMLMQRAHTKMQMIKKSVQEKIAMPQSYEAEEARWRPFQIAFILLSLDSIVNYESEYRQIVDLIWFPTGGGKTEAYLGLTAFTIFYRRMNNPTAVSGGTTVIMRYTLRLLTSQQFQRACTLICACEKIRDMNQDLGDEQISIGLWLGGSSTPNTIKDADARIGELMRQGFGAQNPFQVLSCPWCGTHMTKINGEGYYCYRVRKRPERFVMWCPNENCHFNAQKELPIKIVDEDIYNNPTTLLFGTVDKFALMPWKEEISRIFALDEDNVKLSPELIIQDELHLISGALGTVVGAYESAIDLLCSAKKRMPKVVASTATIRRASEQCRSLYARETRQFPSPGIDSSDSFFAREAKFSDKPGRLYVGVMPSGNTSTTMQVHLIANLMQGVNLLEATPEVKDKYWTQVVYCNSIRELGTSKSIVNDDVKSYSAALVDRCSERANTRYYSDSEVVELTSRVSAEGIPGILQNLNTAYDGAKSNPIELLLATNMISVGVDIDRLGLMTVLGQPKTTSEYIQASSRVGRKYPGLVITLYSPVKSRDRSHFERFCEYHQSIYRFVEPTSVTPFSAPARDKTLPAIILSLVRHYLGFHKNGDLLNLPEESEKLKELVVLLLKRIKITDEAEMNDASLQIDEIIGKIIEICSLPEGAAYSSAGQDKEKLLLMRRTNDDKGKGYYPIPQSMRSTDSEVYLTVDHTS